MSTSTVAPITNEQALILASPEIAAEIESALPGVGSVDDAAGFDPSLPVVLVGDDVKLFHAAILLAVREDRPRLVYVLGTGSELPKEAAGFPIFGFLSRPLHSRVVESMVHAAQENMLLHTGRHRLERDLSKAFIEIDELNNIGAALSGERDTTKLLDLILQKSREITKSDAGSIYLVEEDEKGSGRVLRFSHTQNDSVNVPFRESTMPIDKSRISSYVALTGETLHIEDVYNLPPDLPYGFAKDFDARIGYRTKSMLTVPMQNHKGEIVGVLQLLNHKTDWV